MYKLLILKFKLSHILSTGFGFWFNRNFYILAITFIYWYYYFALYFNSIVKFSECFIKSHFFIPLSPRRFLFQFDEKI
ncbi:hypothetical protein BpHYR1_044364 [Brachionus plicatilis]|uniref:Uncharacterized protein n=1 Tax=Brachionus plicatilis TaxID=10195 RepID=A0A3M7STI9_BRAPC|nr:hypothetical protein BpHYR1_044364 [Brachionus plicatilis]